MDMVLVLDPISLLFFASLRLGVRNRVGSELEFDTQIRFTALTMNAQANAFSGGIPARGKRPASAALPL